VAAEQGLSATDIAPTIGGWQSLSATVLRLELSLDEGVARQMRAT
jgi:hypothetical protein